MLQMMVAGMSSGDSINIVAKRFSSGFDLLLAAHNAAEQVIRAAIPSDKSPAKP